MNIGVMRETGEFERRVALTPSVARQLVEHGNTVWVEKRRGRAPCSATTSTFAAGAHIAYSQAEVIAPLRTGGEDLGAHRGGVGPLPPGRGGDGLLPHGGGAAAWWI